MSEFLFNDQVSTIYGYIGSENVDLSLFCIDENMNDEGNGVGPQ